VKCAFGTICGTLNFTAPKEQLHYAARHNFTAACRNFTFDDIQGFALIYLPKCDIINSLIIGIRRRTIVRTKEGVWVLYVE
jgi:hypothetical protein